LRFRLRRALHVLVHHVSHKGSAGGGARVLGGKTKTPAVDLVATHRHADRSEKCSRRGPSLKWGRNWAAQWYLARAMEERFRGCHAKRLYVNNRRSGGGARGCDFEERVGAYALTEGGISYSLAVLGRLMYGSASSITWNESGYTRSEIPSSDGTAVGRGLCVAAPSNA